MYEQGRFPTTSCGFTSAYLDPVETTVERKSVSALLAEPPEPYELVTGFRHSGWSRQRDLIFSAFRKLVLRYNRIEAFRVCGSSNWILRSKSEPELFRLVPDFCHDRFCVPCSRVRQATIRSNLASHLHDGPYRFLTLTIRHGSEPLSVLLRKLYSSFRKLRQRALWRDNVNGGASFLELSYNPETHSWHPHLHCVLEGRYIHRPDLVKLWFSCTGDSTGVYIKMVRQREHVIDYISKYVTKPLSAKAIDEPELLAEAILCLKSKRMLVTFGCWKGWKLTRPTGNDEWEMYCHENALHSLDADYNPEADNVRAMICTADPKTGEFWVCSGDIPP